MTEYKLFLIITYKMYSDSVKSVRGLDVNAVTIYEKKRVNEKHDNEWCKYKILCLYIYSEEKV